MNRRYWWLAVAALLLPLAGCLNVQTPREINIGSGARSDRPDERRSAEYSADEDDDEYEYDD